MKNEIWSLCVFVFLDIKSYFYSTKILLTEAKIWINTEEKNEIIREFYSEDSFNLTYSVNVHMPQLKVVCSSTSKREFIFKN